MQNSQIGTSSINKILCYGSISYLDSSMSDSLRFVRLLSISHFFVGNIPERSKADHFFKQGNKNEFDLNLHDKHRKMVGKGWSQ